MRRWGFLLALMAGCGGDPEASPLEPGQRVVLIPGFQVDGQPSDSLAVKGDEGRLVLVDAGTEAKVVVDPGRPETRQVKVRIVEGEKSGLLTEVSRSCCRAAR